MSVVEDLLLSIESIGGKGSLEEIYGSYALINPTFKKPTIRRTLQQYSSDATSFLGKDDLFFSVEGLGKGVWGLRYRDVTPDQNTQEAILREGEHNPKRNVTTVERIVRDTLLANEIKKLVGLGCQYCNEAIMLPNKKIYSEGHHLKPLGRKHRGPDVAKNIIILCPNCHVKFDYGLLKLDYNSIKNNIQNISEEFIEYHNTNIFQL